MRKFHVFLLTAAVMAVGCGSHDETALELVVLDPGHFHATLVQKQDIAYLADTVHVYAPPSRS